MGNPQLVLMQHHRLRAACEVYRIGALKGRRTHAVQSVAAPVGDGKVAPVKHDGVPRRGEPSCTTHRGESRIIEHFDGSGSVEHHIDTVGICSDSVAQIAQAAAIGDGKRVCRHAVVGRPVGERGGSAHEGAFVEHIKT